jgi:hypothetical protein
MVWRCFLVASKVTMTVVRDMVAEGAKGLDRELVMQAVERSDPDNDQTVKGFYENALKAKLALFPSAADLNTLPEDGLNGVPDVGQDDDHDGPRSFCDAPIGTSGAESCIAVALTVQWGEHRYNAMYHCSGIFEYAAVLKDLREAVEKCERENDPDAPAVDFSAAKWFTVGGAHSMVLQEDDLLNTFAAEGIEPVVHFTNGEVESQQEKIVLLSKDGELSFRLED